jgi:hypothetical protein
MEMWVMIPADRSPRGRRGDMTILLTHHGAITISGLIPIDMGKSSFHIFARCDGIQSPFSD